MGKVEGSYYTVDVVRHTGLSQRQVHYLIAKKLVRPSIHFGVGTGDYHQWSYDDVKKLRRIKKRIDWGLTLEAAVREQDPPFPVD